MMITVKCPSCQQETPAVTNSAMKCIHCGHGFGLWSDDLRDDIDYNMNDVYELEDIMKVDNMTTKTKEELLEEIERLKLELEIANLNKQIAEVQKDTPIVDRIWIPEVYPVPTLTPYPYPCQQPYVWTGTTYVWTGTGDYSTFITSNPNSALYSNSSKKAKE